MNDIYQNGRNGDWFFVGGRQWLKHMINTFGGSKMTPKQWGHRIGMLQMHNQFWFEKNGRSTRHTAEKLVMWLDRRRMRCGPNDARECVWKGIMLILVIRMSIWLIIRKIRNEPWFGINEKKKSSVKLIYYKIGHIFSHMKCDLVIWWVICDNLAKYWSYISHMSTQQAIGHMLFI